MSYFSAKRREGSPYMEELIAAKCVVLMANFVSGMQRGFDEPYNEATFERLAADVAAVRQEYDASPDDMQLAMQANDAQLMFGAEEEAFGG